MLLSRDDRYIHIGETRSLQQLVKLQFAEAEPQVRIEFTRLLEVVAEQVEHDQPPAMPQDSMRRRHRPRRQACVVERLAENREVDALRLDRRRLDVAQPVFEVGETVFTRQRRAELHHLFRVIDCDNVPSRARKQLRERAFAGAKVCNDHRRQQAQ